MKKIIIFCLLFMPAIAHEEIPLLIDPSAINIEFESDNSSLINIDNMKKANPITKTKNETNKQKLKLDTRQIHHQRTLDYMNNKNGTMLPIF